MLLAITTEGKIGLGVLAGVFIVFALLSAFYFPRRDPNFPGNRLGLFALVTTVLFVGTIAGVVVFAKEEEEGHAAETTETQGTETAEETTTDGSTTGEEVEGDPAAGETVYTSAGCGGCHTFEAAGSSGNIGPNLDETKPDQALVVERVTNGQGAMPAFGDQLDEQQIQDVAAFVAAGTQG